MASFSSSFDVSPDHSHSSGSADNSSSEESSITVLSSTTDDSPARFQNSSTWDHTKRCFICDKLLTKLIGRRRHHCRWCGNTVCKKHARTRRQVEGQSKALRICDLCNKRLVNQSHNAVLLDEKAALRMRLATLAKEIHEKQLMETDVTKDVERLRFDLTAQESAAKDAKKQLEMRIKDEGSRVVSNQSLYTSLDSAVQEATNSLSLTQDRLNKKQSEVATNRSEVAHLQEQQKVLSSDVETGVKNMQERVHIAQIAKFMCEPCRTRLYNSSFTEESLTRPREEQKPRSQSMVERKACAGQCGVM